MSPRARRVGGALPVILIVAFIVVPLVELFLIIQVGQVVGAWWTIAALVVVSVVGAWLVKREGRAAWQRFRGALGSARVPATEVIDGALVLVGGTLLLTPGFLTDVAGLLLVIPPSRAVANGLIRSRVRGRLGFSAAGSTRGRAGAGAAATPVDVEIVDVRRTEQPPQR